MAYLLDGNLSIDAKPHYGFDFRLGIPGLVIGQTRARLMLSVEKVGDELLAIEDR